MEASRVSYLRIVQKLADAAKAFFSNRNFTKDQLNLVVIDIDGTAIDCLSPVKTNPTYYTEIAPILGLYKHLREAGYVLVFLTARQEHHRTLTESNLEHVGYSGYHKLIMMPSKFPGYSMLEIIKWKDEQRRELKETHGFHLVGCIGDQDADVVGDHIGEFQFRLPEPPKIGLQGLFEMLKNAQK